MTPAEKLSAAQRLYDSARKLKASSLRSLHLHLWAFSRRRRIELEGEDLWVAPPEYVILRKLEYFKECGSGKHIDDIRGMMEISGKDIDTRVIEEKAGEMELLTEWKSLLANNR